MNHPFVLTLLVLLSAIPARLHAQASATVVSEPFATFFTIDDGLPSNEIYDLECDSLGRLWICTDNGVATFDGNTFHRVDLNGNHPVITQVERDPQGQLWFATLNGDILRYAPESDQLEAVIQPAHYNANTPFGYFQISDSLLVQHFHPGLAAIARKQGDSLVHEKYLVSDDVSIDLILYNDGLNFFNADPLAKNYEKLRIWKHHTLVKEVQLEKGDLDPKGIRIEQAGQTVFLQLPSEVIRIGPDLDVQVMGLETFSLPSLETENEDYLWLGLANSGVVKMDQHTLEVKGAYLDDYSVSCISKGEPTQTWIGTLNHGLALVNFEEVHHLSIGLGKERITQTASLHDKLFVGTNQGRIYMVQEKGGNYEAVLWKQEEHAIHRMYMLDHRIYVKAGPIRYFVEYDGEQTSVITQPQRGLENFADFREDGDRLILKHGKLSTRIRNRFDLGKLGTYYGTGNLSAFYDPETRQCEPLLPDSLVDIRSACLFSHDSILLGTKSRGLMLAQKGHVLQSFALGDGQESVVHMCRNPNGIFMSTGQRLLALERLRADTLVYRDWNDLLGWGSLEIDALQSWGADLVVSTSEGVFIFDPSEIRNAQPVAEMQRITLSFEDSEVINPTQSVSISSKAGNIQVTPWATGFSNMPGIEYRYRLLPIDSQWSYASGEIIMPNPLRAGDYTLEVCARNKGLSWSAATAVPMVIYDPYAVRFAWIIRLLEWLVAAALTWFIIRKWSRIVSIIKRAAQRWERWRSATREVETADDTEVSKLSIPTQTGIQIIDLDKIIRLQSDSNYTRVILSEGKEMVVSRTLKKFEESLKRSSFIRVHRQHMVNLDYVHVFTSSDGGFLVLKNGSEVPVGKHYRKAIEKAVRSSVISI